jgi:hypothetical protein
MRKILGFVAIIALFSCEDDAVEKGLVELITQSNWERVSVIDTNDGQELLNECEEDDLHTFTEDGDYLYNPGSDLCGSEVARIDNWSFSPNEEELNIDGTIYELNKLTEDSLIYTGLGFILYKHAH